jgi:hypothetical protein
MRVRLRLVMTIFAAAVAGATWAAPTALRSTRSTLPAPTWAVRIPSASHREMLRSTRPLRWSTSDRNIRIGRVIQLSAFRTAVEEVWYVWNRRIGGARVELVPAGLGARANT